MALIGYARVSTKGQSLNHQLDALKKAGCIKIFQEKTSGSTMDRDAFNKCLEYMREGDILVVTHSDRIGRNFIEAAKIITQDLIARKLKFQSLSEQFDTYSPCGEMVINILLSVAHAQRRVIGEKVREGLAAARARGVVGGRKFKLNPEQVEKLLALYVSGIYPRVKLCKMFDISSPSLCRYVERARVNGTLPKKLIPKN